MFILAMRCTQLQNHLAEVKPTTTCRHLSKWRCGKERRKKQPAAASPTTTCRRIWRFTLGNGLHKEEIYGSKTYNAVLDYQRKNNLAAGSLLLAGRWK